MKCRVRLDEKDTRIARDIDAKPEVYPDTIAGLQRGDVWTLRIGNVAIDAEDRAGLWDIVRAIKAKIGDAP